MGGKRIIPVNGVELCVETFGDPGDPAILLIGGAASSMDWWEDEFCARLAAGLRFVIRYDNRDTGQSTSYPAGKPTYGFDDLAKDAAALLNACQLDRAHIVGVSMGGMIGQRLALDYPDRVASLTAISTSPGGPGGPENPDLPPITERLLAAWAEDRPKPDWTNRADVIEESLRGQWRFAGSRPIDEARVRELAGRIADRTIDMEASQTNHFVMDRGTSTRPRLGQLTAPTLVIHGTEDPLFQYGHAEALAREIPGAQLLPLAGFGHQVPPPDTWDTVIPAILRHTSGGWDQQVERLYVRSQAAGDPTGWFDRAYRSGADAEIPMPWNRTEPSPLLTEWAKERQFAGAAAGRRAVVVGSGLGADTEYLGSLGYDTTGFDIAETAVRETRQRFPESPVRYLVADLLNLPDEWARAFDLVVEIITVQALPDPPRHQAIANVGRLVAPGGTLLVVANANDERQALGKPIQTPPWPLTRAEIDAFGTDGLDQVRVERVSFGGSPEFFRWRAEFHRPE